MGAPVRHVRDLLPPAFWAATSAGRQRVIAIQSVAEEGPALVFRVSASWSFPGPTRDNPDGSGARLRQELGIAAEESSGRRACRSRRFCTCFDAPRCAAPRRRPIFTASSPARICSRSVSHEAPLRARSTTDLAGGVTSGSATTCGRFSTPRRVRASPSASCQRSSRQMGSRRDRRQRGGAAEIVIDGQTGLLAPRCRCWRGPSRDIDSEAGAKHGGSGETTRVERVPDGAHRVANGRSLSGSAGG